MLINNLSPIAVTTDALPRVHGAGGGGSKSGGGSASSAPDTLFSTATVRLVDLLGEGEIVGVRGGLKGIYLNDVPVQNEDGSFNFMGLTAEFRVGTPDQPYMAGYPDVQTPRNVGIKVNAATPVTASITDTDVDRLRVTIQVPSLFLAKSDGSVRANSVSYRIEARYSGGPWVNSLGDQTITGKTTSGYFRSHEIALPTNPSGASAPWQVRVTRLSPDTDDFNNSQAKFTNQSDLVFYSTTSIVDARFSYPHSAMVGLTAQASSFGSSVPGRTYLVDGVLMPIPSNYDPVARTYSGVWDGTFKEGFSNNPAWALNLILRNDRFGLGEFIDTAAIDKWSLYEIGRYCDVPVSDGKGGHEPRYVFNGAISTQQEAFELLQLVAQVFRGTVYWSSGTVTAAQDRPSDPVLLVTEANALEGENGEVFAYASSGRRARHTVALVAWNDPDNLYKQTIEVVEDSDGVARYGYNPTRIDLLGCTSRGQAHRTGLWTLFTELHQTQVLTYRAGLDHAVIRPGDIVAVQDPQIANLDLSGRLKAGSTASVLVLDRPVTLASGAAYTVSVVVPDGTVQEREISTGAGTVSSVTLRSALSQVPDPAAVWLIAGPIEPQLFRVVSIREEEPHIYAVAALQHEPGKYATIDDGVAFEPSPITEFPNIVLPPTNLSVRESQYTELGQPKQAMTLSWLPGQPFNSVAYFVTVIRPSGATVTTRTASQSIDFLEAEVGVWTFVVVAIGLNGKSSLPAQTTYTLSGWAGQAATTVAGLSVKGGGSTFTGRSCTVAWTNQIAASVPPYPVRNAVYVFDASTQVMVHREVLPAGVTEWTYDYFLNVNEGGPRRQFRVGVTAYSAAGDEGPPSYLTVSNPAPEIIVPTLGSTSEVLFVDLPKVADADFAGYLVWVSETPNINPLTAPSYDVAGNSFTYRGVPDKTYYVRAAAYDAFSKDPAQLNVSAELSKKLTIQLFDPLAPPIPGTPTLASNVAEIAPDGAVTAKVTIQWPAVTSTNLATYEVAIAEGNNPAQATYIGGRLVSGTTAAFAGLMPGRQYSFKVRSNPLNGFADSGWSAVLVVKAALNTTPPAAPTGFAASASFEAANLAWTNPTNKDLLGIEIWAGTTNVLANAALLKTVPAPAAFYRDVLGTTATKFYWIRSVNTSDFKSGYVGPLSVNSAALAAAQLAAGVIDATKLASSIAANTVVTSLPATKTTAYVTLGDEQYRWDAAAGRYTKAVSAADIAGKIAAAQIDTIAAGQITGQVQAAQVAALEASKITGTLTSAQIASLDATKIAGQLTNAQIASGLDASKVSGALANATLATSALSGSIVDSQIAAGVSAAKVSGDLTNATLATARLSGTISNDQIANGIAAAKIAGQLTTTQISDSAITTGKLAAAAVEAGNIAVGAIVASKLAVASINLVPNGDIAQGTLGHAVNADSGHGLTTTAIAVEPLSGPDSLPNLVLSGTGSLVAGKRLFSTSRVQRTGGNYDLLPVTPGQWYEVSAYLSGSPGAQGFVAAVWYTSVAAYISESTGNILTLQDAPAGGLATRPRSFRVVQAPANAAYLVVRCNLYNASAAVANPVLRIAGIMAAPAVANQTEPSPFISPGQTIISGGNILTRTITASAIAVGGIIAENIAAKAITANKLVLVDSQNLNLNPSFQQGYEDWLRSTADVTIAGISNASTGDLPASAPALNALRMTRTTANVYVQSLTDPGGGLPRGTPCSAGDLFYLEAMVYSDVAGPVNLQAVGYTAANGLAGGASVNVNVPAGVWTKVSATLGVVSTMVGANCRISNNINNSSLWITNVRFQRKNGAELIVDGTISARKLQIGATVANLIPAGEFLDGLDSYDKSESVNFIIGRTGGPTGGYYLRISRNGVTTSVPSLNAATIDFLPVEGGAVYEAVCYIRANINGTTGFRYRLLWYDASKVALPGTSAGAGTGGVANLASYTDVWANTQAFTTSWAGLSKQITPPAAARYFKFQVYHHTEGGADWIDIANVSLRRAMTATTIENGAITTAKLDAFAVTADKILAGAITTSKLAIVTSNLAFNPDASQGVRGWSLAGYTTAVAPNPIVVRSKIYAPSGFDAIEFNCTGAQATDTGRFDMTSTVVSPMGVVSNYPVTGGTTYEFSACMSTHRCTGSIIVTWINASGAGLGSSTSSVVPPNSTQGGDYASFPKATLIAVAPAGATTCEVRFRAASISGAAPYLFVSCFMFAATRAGATETSPYVAPGITTIDGAGILTNSITTRVIAAGAVTADQIGANAVTATKILAGSVQTGHMVAGSINADRLVAQSITAGLIAGSTITGDKIAGRTISAGNIVTGTLTGNEIQANSVNADRLVANSITAAQIAAGAVKTAQLDAGAITADKMGIGLNTGNLIWNSDRELAGFVSFVPAAGVAVGEQNTDWVVTGVKGISMLAGGANPNTKASYFDISCPLADGSKTTLWPIQAGQTYEYTCYLSAHRCRCYLEAHVWNGSSYVQSSYGSNIENVQGVGAPTDVWRSRLKFTAPANAQSVILRVTQITNGQNDAYLVASAPYFGVVPPGTPANVYSAYAPQSRTIISGGQVSTNSLHANRITAGTITTDRVATGGLHADRIQSGTITTTQLQAGGVHADRIQAGTITATQIAANSITAGRLNIEARGIMPVNVYFEMERDGNGNATGWLKWTAGQIEWIDDNGNRAFSGIPAGRMNRGSDGWVTVWFDKAAPGQLWANAGNNIPSIRANPNCVLVATSADLTGVIVNWGGTVIDGDKIVANSIQARNIAANQIQTQHMAANSISGDRIQAGTLSADKITTGTLTVNAVFSLGSNGQTDIYAHPNGGLFRVRNRELNQWRAAFGYIGDYTGDGNDFGLLLWGTDGVNRIRFSNAINFVDGVTILDATIQNAKIANLTIGNEKVQNDAITNGAASIGGAFQRDREVFLNIRRAGTRVGIWVSRTGNPSTMSLASSNPGLLRTLVARPGQGWGDIRQIPNAFTFEYVGNGNALRHMPTSDMSHYTCDVAGVWGFRVIDDSNSDSSAASITVVEFSK